MPSALSTWVRLRPVIAVLVVLAVLLTLLWLGQRRLIYFPDREPPEPVANAREATLQTSDGLRLTAWLVAPAAADRRLAVLVAPGNAGNRGDRIPLAEALASAGLTVLLLDYRGYGANPGRPTEVGLARDARAGLTYLGDQGYGPERIIYFGESLGAAVVVDLAGERAPAGLVLRSPFVDLASVAAHHYPWLPVRALLRDRFRLADTIERIAVPTTVIYGSADSVVPPGQSREVADRGGGVVRVVVVDGADHNDPALAYGAPIDAVLELAGRIGRPTPPG
jgi:hypothetical protein